jgi:predicted nucleotidyltransferase
VHKYKEYLIEKEKRIKEDNAGYFDSVNSRLPNVFKQAGGRFKEIERIIVFGSFIDGTFNRSSDLDLYIEGLSAANYFAVKRYIEESLDIDINLYNDGDNKDFIKKIKSGGVVFYERKASYSDC